MTGFRLISPSCPSAEYTEDSVPSISRSSEDDERVDAGGDDGDPSEDDFVETNLIGQDPHNQYNTGY